MAKKDDLINLLSGGLTTGCTTSATTSLINYDALHRTVELYRQALDKQYKREEKQERYRSGPSGLSGFLLPVDSSEDIKNMGQAMPAKQVKEPKKILTPKEIVAYLDRFVIGHSAAKKMLAVGVYYHYFRVNTLKQNKKNNICLVGPTGTGKTYTLTKIAECLNVPFVTVDATELTPDGYVGKDIGSFVNDIKVAAGQKKEHAIVFIDEIDKLATNSYGKGGVPIGHRSSFKTSDIQQALLKIVEGRPTGEAMGWRSGGSNNLIDTTNMLFVIGGAFSGITSQPGYANNITPDDLIAYGLLPEFVGRFPIIAQLESLGLEAMKQILMSSEECVFAEYEKIFKEHGAKLIFSPDAIDLICRAAIAKGLGARALRGIVEDVLLEPLYDLPHSTKKQIVRVTSDGILFE